jgi:hypothetical protein
MKMYLSMTEQDYQSVRREARLQTALALGISNAPDLIDSDLDTAINRLITLPIFVAPLPGLLSAVVAEEHRVG